MRKVFVLALALVLAIPAGAFFKAKPEIVTVTKTNYVVCTVVGAVTLAVGLLAGKFLFPNVKGIQEKYLETINKGLYNSYLKFVSKPDGDKMKLSLEAFNRNDSITTA
jgi:hypothetical protein